MDTVGKRLRAAREAKGYTTRQLYELTKLPEEQIVGFETDQYYPNILALVALQMPLKCSIEWLLTGVNPLYSSSICDGVLLTPVERNLVAMFRLLNQHDRCYAFDVVSMLYEQGAGTRESSYRALMDSTK